MSINYVTDRPYSLRWFRTNFYWFFIVVLYAAWWLFMDSFDRWHLFVHYWEVSITMIFGSMVAGSTATGGGAVSFPVLTKLLGVSSYDAKLFGLMVQSVGMSSACIYMWARKIPILWPVIPPVIIGSTLGIIVSNGIFNDNNTLCKLIFTATVTLFMAVLLYSSYFHPRVSLDRVKNFISSRFKEFLLVGFIGGIIAGKVGSGVDIILFVVLTLVYRIDERLSIPTTIVSMAISSIVGFSYYYFLNDITTKVFDYWLVSIPVVAIGAPLGAYILQHCHRAHIVYLMAFLIALDLVSSLLFIRISSAHVYILISFLVVCSFIFVALIRKGDRLHRFAYE
ncbi:MAG: sulfite exporter TauE/SafE family protein [Cellvibrionaceae bacterium]